MKEKAGNTPKNLEYPTQEAVFLSGIFHDPNQFPQVAGILTENMFSVPFYKSVWNAFLYLYNHGSIIDPITVSNHLITVGCVRMEPDNERKVLPEVDEIYNRAYDKKVPILAYAKDLKSAAAMRDIVTACNEAVCEAYESDNPDEVRATIISCLLGINTTSSDNIHSMAQIGQIFRMRLGEDVETKKSRIIHTGYQAIDNLLGGIPQNSINVIVAYQKIGKSTLTTQFSMYEAVADDHASIIFSLEMPKEMVYQRMVQIHSGLPVKEIMNGSVELTPFQRKQLEDAMLFIDALPIHIVDTDCHTIAGIRSHVHQFRAKNPHLNLTTIQIDHFHLLDTGNHKDEMTGMNKNVNAMLGLIRETGIRIMLPAQLKDPFQNYGNKKQLPCPKLHDLRYAKTLIDAAFNIMAIHRPNFYTHDISGPESCELHLLASRDSAKSGNGKAELYYNHKRGAFYDNNEGSYWFLGKVQEYSSSFFRRS